MNCFYTVFTDSLCWLKVVLVRDLSTLSFLLVLAFMLFMYWVKVMHVSSVMPRSCECLSNRSSRFMGVIWECVCDSCLSGVKSVIVNFVGDADILFFVSHRSNECMYFWKMFAACCVLRCCEVIAISSAQVRVVTFGGGFGRSWRKRLNRNRDKTKPWGSPFARILIFYLDSLF